MCSPSTIAVEGSQNVEPFRLNIRALRFLSAAVALLVLTAACFIKYSAVSACIFTLTKGIFRNSPWPTVTVLSSSGHEINNDKQPLKLIQCSIWVFYNFFVHKWVQPQSSRDRNSLDKAFEAYWSVLVPRAAGERWAVESRISKGWWTSSC